MSTIGEVIVGLIIGSGSYLFILNITQEVNRRRALKQKLHKLKMMEERNKQVYYFRARMINMFSFRVYLIMLPYDDMLKSEKPLEAKEWIDIDKLVNLN